MNIYINGATILYTNSSIPVTLHSYTDPPDPVNKWADGSSLQALWLKNNHMLPNHFTRVYVLIAEMEY